MMCWTQVLQYGVLVMDVADERYVIDTLRQLVVVMRSQSGSENLNKRDQPEFDVGEEQLSYLVEQVSLQRISAPCLVVAEEQLNGE